MFELDNNNNFSDGKVIVTKNISVMCDDRCCGHCKYYDGKGYCSDGKPVTPTHYCSSFSYANY